MSSIFQNKRFLSRIKKEAKIKPYLFPNFTPPVIARNEAIQNYIGEATLPMPLGMGRSVEMQVPQGPLLRRCEAAAGEDGRRLYFFLIG